MKKILGMHKEIDRLGRIVIPKELRSLYHLDEEVEIVMTDEGVLLRNPLYKVVKIRNGTGERPAE